MAIVFILIAAATTVCAVAAMFLRQPVHCALSLAMSFAGLAAVYLQLGAEFIGLVQILVYVGAVAILIVFAMLLTQGSDNGAVTRLSPGSWSGGIVALVTFVALVAAISDSSVAGRLPGVMPDASVKRIGLLLLGDYVVPLEVIGLLLTVALLGAVLIALPEGRKR
jgi:NADH-quinone oxidoreductase subunit J